MKIVRGTLNRVRESRTSPICEGPRAMSAKSDDGDLEVVRTRVQQPTVLGCLEGLGLRETGCEGVGVETVCFA
jgi:hypothetical protein